MANSAKTENLLLSCEQIINAYARKRSRYGSDDCRAELVQEGWLAATEALRRYDAKLGVPFPAFAAPRIRGQMLSYLAKASILERRWQSAIRRLERVSARYRAIHGVDPSEKEAAELLGLPVERVRALRHAAYAASMVSLDVCHGDEGALMVECIPDTSASIETEEGTERRRAEVNKILQEVLGNDGRQVELAMALLVDRRRGIDVANEFGVSPARISQIKSQLVTRLGRIVGLLKERGLLERA